MTRLSAALAACALYAAPALAGNVDDIRVALPETLELAEIQPGLQVVTRLDIEVFSVGGAYWLQNGGRWYASRRPSEAFQAVEARGVPPALARLERGRYLDYRPAEGQRVTRRRGDVEAAAPAGGGQVDAGPAKVVPRSGAPTAAPATAPARAEAKPGQAPKAGAKAAPPGRKAPAKPAAKPAPQKKPPARK